MMRPGWRKTGRRLSERDLCGFVLKVRREWGRRDYAYTAWFEHWTIGDIYREEHEAQQAAEELALRKMSEGARELTRSPGGPG